jgi:hypothetical protein
MRTIGTLILAQSSRMFTTLLFLAVCISFVNLNQAAAQQATAQISGAVKDPSGAIVVGATVTLKNSDTGIVHDIVTNKDGSYLFTLVPIGTYEMSVTRQGFRKFEQKGIKLEINQNARVDVSLQLGNTSEVVEVNADATQVDTVSATLGKVETTDRILSLPLVERDTMQLGLLQAGVFAPEQEDGSGNAFSVAGQRSESLSFLIDGADNNDFLGNNMVVNPNPDAVAEFKILTNNYEAEYGRTSGGIVNQVIKSGTNRIHGSLFEFFRNTDLDASDYFLSTVNADGSVTHTVPEYKRNLFGGSIGLPIKKDRAFFFASYQGARRREGQIAPSFQTLSPAERTGDFSALLSQGTQLIDPTTGANYSNNQVPVDPVIANYIAKYVPLPNLPNNQFVSSPTAKLQDDQFVFRFDYNLSSKDSLSAFYIFDDQPQIYPFQIQHGASTGGDVPVGSGFSNAQRFQTGSIGWTRTISPRMVNEFRFATNRSATLQSVPADTTSPQALGFATVNPDDPKGAAPPLMFVNGSFTLGPSPQGPTKLHDTTFQYQDTLSWTHGQHQLKFGGDLRWVENNFNFDFFNNGSFFFGDFGAFTGDNLADFVGGFWDNYFQFSTARYGIRTHSLYFFGQDAWKIRKNLSLDFGLRYEYNSPQVDPGNEIIGWFPGRQSTKFPGSPPDLLYPGDPNTPNRGLVYPDRNNLAPRLGFSWDMLGDSKLVMRGGFGIFYDIEDGALNLQFGGQPPFGYVANNFPDYSGATPSPGNSFVSDPFGSFGYPDPYPFALQGKIGTFFSPAISFAFAVSPHFRTPYSEHFNYGFQYQLTKDTMLEAVYAGSLGRKSIVTTETNFPTLAALQAQLAAAGGDPSALNPECARPLAACDASGNPTGAQEIETNTSSGTSSSHQLQVTVDRRLRHGLQFRAAYTLSKSIDDNSGFRARSSTLTDPLNPHLDRGLADFDATHRLVVSPIWQLPLGSHGSSLLNKIAGGWSVAAIASFQSGNPFTIYSNNNSSELDNFLDRVDVIGPVQIFKDPRPQRTFILPLNSTDPTQTNYDPLHYSCVTPTGTDPGSGAPTVTGHFYFDPKNLVCATGVPGGVPLFSHGNMGRNSLRGPGINNWDISILKDFKFTETKSLEFQANFFNAFNHVQFFGPSSTDGASGFSSNFGQVTSDSTPSTTTAYYRGPRLIQLR